MVEREMMESGVGVQVLCGECVRVSVGAALLCGGRCGQVVGSRF
jgi:hypothetical protein